MPSPVCLPICSICNIVCIFDLILMSFYLFSCRFFNAFIKQWIKTSIRIVCITEAVTRSHTHSPYIQNIRLIFMTMNSITIVRNTEKGLKRKLVFEKRWHRPKWNCVAHIKDEIVKEQCSIQNTATLSTSQCLSHHENDDLFFPSFLSALINENVHILPIFHLFTNLLWSHSKEYQ